MDKIITKTIKEKIFTLEQILTLINKKSVSEEEYKEILKWYFNENIRGNWLGSIQVDGFGEQYALIINCKMPEETKYLFYLEDDYYLLMNKDEGQ